MSSNKILGIDVGGSGIKGAVVDVETGKLTVERHRIATPHPATPENIANIIKKIAGHFDYEGKIGVGYPAVIKNGIIRTATNIDKSNIEIDANELFSKITGNEVCVINDADAAGIAENGFGHGKNVGGTVLFITVGTGIGSALFVNGKLVPNTEFGHLFMHNGMIAEKYTSDLTRKSEDLKWSKWGNRFNKYLQHLELLLSPKLFIVGGGVSKKMDKFKDSITVNTPVKPAMLRNEAGIIGAAMSMATER